MSKLGFYNDNMFRAYPFMADDDRAAPHTKAVNSAIVDVGFVVTNPYYVAGLNGISLTGISLVGDTIFFGFSASLTWTNENHINNEDNDALVLRDYPAAISFRQNVDVAEFTPAEGEAQTATIAYNIYNKDGIAVGFTRTGIEGFLVTGNLTELRDYLSRAGGILQLSYSVEPARIQVLNSSVNFIGVANKKRVVVPPCRLPETCVDPFEEEPAEEEIPGDDLVFPKNCLCVGDIIFLDGTNTRITQNTNLNLINVAAHVGAGALTSDKTMCYYNGSVPFTEEESILFFRPERDENGTPIQPNFVNMPAIPFLWRQELNVNEELTAFGATKKLPLYELADKEAPTDKSLATVAYSDYLNGGPACAGLITSINGIGGENVNLIAGKNIQITVRQNPDDECEPQILINISPTARGNCTNG